MSGEFSFATAGEIIARPGAASLLPEYWGRAGRRRPDHVLLVSDRGVVGAGLLRQPMAALAAAGLRVTVFDGVVADPPADIVETAARIALACGADAVLGFGGGSALDVAKLVAVLAGGPQSLEELYGVGKARGPRLPLTLVPTTAGTGSEVTPIAIVTTGGSEKMGIVSPVLLPDLAVLDATLLVGMPRPVTATTGIDAMVHAIEAVTSRHRRNALSDALARRALALLARGLPRAWDEGGDLEARGDTLLGACLAGMAFANAPVAAVHALAYPIGARFHVAHGLSNSLVLPEVLRFNEPAAGDDYRSLAAILEPEGRRPLADILSDLAARLELPRRLRDVGIGADDLPALARDAMNQTRLLVNNPREMTEADALAIYRAVL